MTEEEGQQQGSDVTAIHISICHNDHLVITDFIRVHTIIFRPAIADTGPNRRDQSADFSRRQHFVQPGPLHIQNFTPQRQDRLIGPVTPLFG